MAFPAFKVMQDAVQDWVSLMQRCLFIWSPQSGNGMWPSAWPTTGGDNTAAEAPAGPAGITDTLMTMPAIKVFRDAAEYWVDGVQRGVLMADVLRERGNTYLNHRQRGMPPVLDFDYEVVLDSATFTRPANYLLLEILPKPGMSVDAKKRPFIVFDPRAGHGPGIGGMKEDSQVGVSLRAGHPTYFVAFRSEPMPNQTLADVSAAEARFIQEVAARHPDADGKPAVIGNCQAGWAVLGLAAVEPGIMGPVIVCGAPMSYWAGVDGKNPMRYMGGLIGGAWMTSMLCDLGGGTFDGAHLVSNFERLNPANTLWSKPYNLYRNIDTERERFLDFERWWTGFFILTKTEMMRIVDDLFVGNKLQRGAIRLESGGKLDLKDVEAPVVVFASGGDNITPPQQALNWIIDVYGSDEEIRHHGKTIVYALHRDIGHLGIFVSGKVATKEHYEINEAIDFIDILPPGLYEMVVDKMPAGSGDRPEDLYETRFEVRSIEDIRRLDDNQQDVEFFPASKLVSEINTRFYDAFISPWVRMMVTAPVARALREAHPLRMQYRFFSDENPMLWWARILAPMVRENRRPAAEDNVLRVAEERLSGAIVDGLEHYREVRDGMQERMFKAIYGPNSLGAFFYTEEDMLAAKFAPIVRSKREQTELDAAVERFKTRINEGGFAEGWARIVAALMIGSGGINEREMEAGRTLREKHPRLAELSVGERKRLLREQSYMVQLDPDRALDTLTDLLQTPEERQQAWDIARAIAMGDGVVSDQQRIVLDRLSTVLQLQAA
jgi:tellurite resistance protein